MAIRTLVLKYRDTGNIYSDYCRSNTYHNVDYQKEDQIRLYRGGGEMNFIEILIDKSSKGTAKRAEIIKMLLDNSLSLNEIKRESDSLNEKQMVIILEAIEEITNKKIKQLDPSYIAFAEKYILSDSNSCKREASRIIGNLAEQYPDKLGTAIDPLILNTNNESTVVRWGSAYALSRIIVLDTFSKSDLFHEINNICDKEQENGVKNQYIKALKKASKIRKQIV